MPRTVRLHEHGGPEVLRIDEVPIRRLKSRELRLRVKAFTLNRADAMFMRGHFMEPATLPATLGYEAVDVVSEVGPEVDKAWLGKVMSTLPAFSLRSK